MSRRQVVNQADWRPLEDKASKFVKDKQPFERLHVSISDLKKMFGYSKYKMYYIENLLPKEGSTVYKCGSLVDLCLGPHIQNTNKIKAFKVMKVPHNCSNINFMVAYDNLLELLLLLSWRQGRRLIAAYLRSGIS